MARHTSDQGAPMNRISKDSSLAKPVSKRASSNLANKVSVPCLRLVASGVDEKGRPIETKRAFAGSAADLRGLLEFLCTDQAHSARANDMRRYVKKFEGKKKSRASRSLEQESEFSQRSQTMHLGKRPVEHKKPIDRI